jgi:RNA polymerase sigma factor (sigma-70 family)
MVEVNEISDARLLRDFAVRRDEAAFREIVTRHADLVYSAALRQVASSAVAADVAQKVFTDLAQKSTAVVEKTDAESSLAGWLHRATRYAALNHLRDDRRRRDHERQAMQQLLTDSEPSADWTQIAPVLDEALDSLGDDDREALLLRYFKNQDFSAVGLALGVSDDTAQKRVSRAVEKLREFFSKRKIAIGAGSLGILISANAVQASPVGLVATISTVVLAGNAVVPASAAITVTKTIAMTTLHKIIIGTTVAVLAGAGLFEARQATQLREQVQTLQQGQTAFTNQLARLEADNTRLSNQVARAQEQKTLSQTQMNELLKLRGQKGQTQTALTELAKMQAQRQANGGLSPMMTNAMRMGMVFAQKAQEKRAQEKVGRMKDLLHLTDDQAQAARDILQRHIEQNNQMALAAISGQKPVIDPKAPTEDAELKALLTPEQLAAWPDFQQAENQAGAQELARSDIALIQTSVDLTPDQQSQAQAALYQYELDQRNNPTNAAARVARTRAKGDVLNADSMAMDMMKQQLTDKLKVLDGILTPDQLKAYEQGQLDMIDMQASAMKLFMPGTNTAATAQ